MSQESNKKRSYSSRQLEVGLDGGYWSVTSPSRQLKRSSSKLDVGSSPNSKGSTPSKDTENPNPASLNDSSSNNNNNITEINTHTSSTNYILSTEDAFYSLPTSINNTVIDFSSPAKGLLSPLPTSTSYAPSSPSSSLPLNVLSDHSFPKILSSPSAIVEEKLHSHTTTHYPSRDISPTKTEEGITRRVHNEHHEKKVEIKAEKKEKEKENPVVFHDPNIELDGSYWATFNPSQKRKKDRVFSDLTGTDSDYWNKRNARVAQKKALPPPPVLTEEQIIKRQERMQQMKDEIKKREQEDHERLTKKKEESQIAREIFPGVYLGSRHAAKNWQFFSDYQIKSVVNVTSDIPNFHEASEINYKKIPIADLPCVNFLEIFDETTAALDELKQRGNVLVHCREGRSRSPSLVLAYGMKYLGKTLADAHEAISSKSDININFGFQQQLMNYERIVFQSEHNTYNFLKKRNPTPEKDRSKLVTSK